jgi:hypothetical protein
LLSSPEASAVSNTLNGVYSATGIPIQILVANGRPGSTAILNNHHLFTSSFIETTDDLSIGTLRITYSFTESGGKSSFVVRYFDTSDNTLLLNFVSEMTVTVLLDTSTEYRTRTVWTMRLESDLMGNTELSSATFVERYVFDLSDFTCDYTLDQGGTITFRRTSTGTGFGQGSPLIPRNPNWTQETSLSFPILNPVRIVWCDPPFAGGFDYAVPGTRKERISHVTLPKGFGGGIQVLARPSNGGSMKLVGTFDSGAKINLLSRNWLKKGTAKISIRKIKPKVDLQKKAPYPVGLKFTNLEQSDARVRIKAANVSP